MIAIYTAEVQTCDDPECCDGIPCAFHAREDDRGACDRCGVLYRVEFDGPCAALERVGFPK